MTGGDFFAAGKVMKLATRLYLKFFQQEKVNKNLNIKLSTWL